MINLYIYPNINTPTQEVTPEYRTYLPFTPLIIHSHPSVQVVTNPEDADFFFMGQFGDVVITPDKSQSVDFLDKPLSSYFARFPFLFRYPHRHILNKDGDWVNKEPPDYFLKCVIFSSSIPTFRHPINYYIHPCQSRPFISLISRYDTFESLAPRSFYFQGCKNIIGTRKRLGDIVNRLHLPNFYLILNSGFSYSDPNDNFTKLYFNRFLEHRFALCPSGGAHDSIRFFEACFFGSIPIVFGDPLLPGEDEGKHLDFFFRISPSLSDEEIEDNLTKIMGLSDEECRTRARKARKYFDEIIRPRIQDPTRCFVDYLENIEIK